MIPVNLPEKYRKCHYCIYIEYDHKRDSHYCDNCFGSSEDIIPNSPICREFELDALKILPETVINDIVKSKAYLVETP